MPDSAMDGEPTGTQMHTARPMNFKEVLQDLKRRKRIFFEKTVSRTNSKSCLVIPRWFLESHGDKFRKIVYLVASPTTRIWTVQLYIQSTTRVPISRNRISEHPPTSLRWGWHEFAAFHGLVEQDRLIFSLRGMSTFDVYIFYPTGEPKESSFPTSRRPSRFSKSGEIGRSLRGKGKTARQLVRNFVAQQVNARREYIRKKTLQQKGKNDVIRSQNPFQSALDVFEPQFVHNYAMQCRRFPKVIGQEHSDDVHLELVMPFSNDTLVISQDFVETKITSVGFEERNGAQTRSQTSLSFLSPSTFRNFNNLGGNMRVQTVVVLNDVPEMNREAGDVSSILPVVQSDSSAAVQADPSAVHPSAAVQSDPSAAVHFDPSPVQSDPPPVVQSDPPDLLHPLVLENTRASEPPIVTAGTATGGTRRKQHRPWTLGEVTTLVEGVARYGIGKWAEIKKLGFSSVGYRNVVDLKDKWRNLVRASEAQLHPARPGERKKHVPSIPAPVLARVRELASLPNQIPSGTVYVGSPSSKWRVVHRK